MRDKDPLTTYIKFATVLVMRDRYLHQRMRELSVPTPGSITKLTENAQRAKKLLARTETTGQRAEMVMNNYEATLTRFEAVTSQVNENEKELSAMMKDMGNATEVIGDIFREDAGGDQSGREKQTVTAAEVGDAGQVVNGGAPKSG